MGALFLIALLSVTATIYYSFAGMRQVIAESMAYGDNQGHQLAKDSRKALRTRIETDLADSAEDQAHCPGQDSFSSGILHRPLPPSLTVVGDECPGITVFDE